MHTVKRAAEMTGLYGGVLFRTSMVALTLALASFPAIPTNASSGRAATSRPLPKASDDPFFHNVFSLSRHANFDLGRYPRNESRSRRFDTPGLVKVFCHIHSHMTASIMVFDHPFFRIPQADGTFRLEDVPAGTHQVSAWHERIGESVSTIRVEPGAVARVEFSLPMEDR